MSELKPIILPPGSALLKPDFTFGVATSSFQIEGHEGKDYPCIWDTFCQQSGAIKDNSNGVDACQHVSLWQSDLELIYSLGVDAYRFSIAWPRVITPEGKLNANGVAFYDRLLDGLLERNIKPYVTLYHWDLPQFLEDKGGWLNRDTAWRFQEYTQILSEHFGDRVFSYATLNEPFCSAFLGYEAGIHAPGLTGQANGRRAAHHLLLAHGLGMQVLQQNAPHAMNGLVLNISPTYPATDSDADRQAAKRADDYHNQWYFRPVLEGQYPDMLDTLPADNRPDIHSGDLDIISQPLDFLGINYYTRMRCVPDDALGFRDIGPDASMHKTAMGWEVFPQGLTDVLCDLHQRYTLPPMYITENGAAFDDQIHNGEVQDDARLAYYQQHLLAVDNAIQQGVDVRGYFGWSLMDNFEWAEGYLKRFGLVYVDYATQQRVLKHSAKAYAQLVKSRLSQQEKTA